MINILGVEDETSISNLIRLSLIKEGYRCIYAFDGAEAVDCLEQNRYDLLVLDVMLPELDGFAWRTICLWKAGIHRRNLR